MCECHQRCEIREQLLRVGSLLLYVASGEALYLLSHLPAQELSLLFFACSFVARSYYIALAGLYVDQADLELTKFLLALSPECRD